MPEQSEYIVGVGPGKFWSRSAKSRQFVRQPKFFWSGK